MLQVLRYSLCNGTTNTHEIRVISLYEFKLGHSAVDARNIAIALGKGSANECTIRRWFSKFSSGDSSFGNEERGRPAKTRNEDLKVIGSMPGCLRTCGTTWYKYYDLF